MISATVIADSISPLGHRLTTMECTFHRYILPEVNTYRAFSRSASSSRAIPISKRIEEVQLNPALPTSWGKNQRGMVADGELDDATSAECQSVWLEAAAAACDYAQYLSDKKVHKQLANRLLEPFLWQTMVISATDFSNMFTQRIHPDAQPEFKLLAEAMKSALDESDPFHLEWDEWHLPFVLPTEMADTEIAKKVSVARCARTSYGSHGVFDLDKDVDLYVRLLEQEPKHWAPTEHVATPAHWAPQPKGNFRGWHQLRHLI